MNIRDLEYLVAIAKYSHFGKAAEACFVSQPALSIQIQKMEKYLGVKLLERSNKQVKLTESGVIIAEQASKIVEQVKELRDVAQAAKDPFKGNLVLGIFPTLAPYLLPKIISGITERYPGLTLHLLEEKTEILIEKLKTGKIHAAILALPINIPGTEIHPIFKEDFLLAIPYHHPFAKKQSINIKSLNEKELLLLEEGHCMRDQMMAFCQKVNAIEKTNFRATSLEVLRHMVFSGSGITLMPYLATEKCTLLKYVSMASPTPNRTLCMVWRKTCLKKFLLLDLVKSIKNILRKNKSIQVLD